MRIQDFFLAAAALGIAAIAQDALAFDELVPGKLFVAKPEGKLVKFIAKAPNPPIFPLPTSDPSGVTTTLQVLDAGGAGGDDTYSLNTGVWKALGNPPGSKGYKYKGAGTAADPCKVVVIKEKIVKAVCKDKGAGGVTLTTPFSGNARVALTIGSDRYCGEWGGTEKKNDVKLVKRKDAAAPDSCSAVTPTCNGCDLCNEMCSDPACELDPTCGWFDLQAVNECLDDNGFFMVASGCDLQTECQMICAADPFDVACQTCALCGSISLPNECLP